MTAAPETETDANGLTEGVLRELGVCEFHEMVTDASMCRCGLPAVNHDTFAEQIVMSDHPTISRLLERVRVVEGERDALKQQVLDEWATLVGRMTAAEARAESAEAAHRALQAERDEAWRVAAQRRDEARRYYVAWQVARMRARVWRRAAGEER